MESDRRFFIAKAFAKDDIGDGEVEDGGDAIASRSAFAALPRGWSATAVMSEGRASFQTLLLKVPGAGLPFLAVGREEVDRGYGLLSLTGGIMKGDGLARCPSGSSHVSVTDQDRVAFDI
jgi:hypothetical protein